jgi:glutaredoxin
MLLDANGVKYQDLDVAGDKAARKQMIDETHQLSVPVVVIDGAVIIGYKESEIKEKLGIQ